MCNAPFFVTCSRRKRTLSPSSFQHTHSTGLSFSVSTCSDREEFSSRSDFFNPPALCDLTNVQSIFFPLFFSWREEGGLLCFLGSEEWDLLPKQKYGVVSALLAARCEPFSTMGDRAASSLVRLLFWGYLMTPGELSIQKKFPLLP